MGDGRLKYDLFCGYPSFITYKSIRIQHGDTAYTAQFIATQILTSTAMLAVYCFGSDISLKYYYFPVHVDRNSYL